MTKPKRPVRRYLKEVPRDENHPLYNPDRMYILPHRTGPTNVYREVYHEDIGKNMRLLSRREADRVNRQFDQELVRRTKSRENLGQELVRMAANSPIWTMETEFKDAKLPVEGRIDDDLPDKAQVWSV